MVFHSIAVEIVVNGVLRTLWVGATMQNQLRDAQKLMTINFLCMLSPNGL